MGKNMLIREGSKIGMSALLQVSEGERDRPFSKIQNLTLNAPIFMALIARMC